MNSAQPFDMAPAPMARAISNGAGDLITGRRPLVLRVFELPPRRAFGSLPPEGVHFALRRPGDKTPWPGRASSNLSRTRRSLRLERARAGP